MRGVLAVLAVAAAACGSTQPAAATVPTITGAPSCAADVRQDLMFFGALVGHLACSTQPLTCQKGIANARQSSGIAIPLTGRVGRADVQLIIMFWEDTGPGRYEAGPPGEGGTSNQGVTLDGMGHWVSKTGGSIVTEVDDAANASGTVDVQLVDGSSSIGVSGSWRCPKPPNFCPTPFTPTNPCYGMEAALLR